MRISHIALYVLDLERSREFYCGYFGARSGERYHNPKTGLNTYFLSFDGGARLELMSRPECAKTSRGGCEAGFAHIALSVGSRDAVELLTRRLEADGITIAGQPRVTGDGYYESTILDPEGNLIEITE